MKKLRKILKNKLWEKREMENNKKVLTFQSENWISTLVRMRGKKIKRGMSLKCEIWWFRHFIIHIFHFLYHESWRTQKKKAFCLTMVECVRGSKRVRHFCINKIMFDISMTFFQQFTPHRVLRYNKSTHRTL